MATVRCRNGAQLCASECMCACVCARVSYETHVSEEGKGKKIILFLRTFGSVLLIDEKTKSRETVQPARAVDSLVVVVKMTPNKSLIKTL